MTIKETPNKITAVLIVTATAEFFDDEASEETVRYAIEQDLEDAGFDVDVAILKEQEKKKIFVDSDGKITPLPDVVWCPDGTPKDMVEVVRCKNCIHRGKAEKCVLAAISKEKAFPLFMLDNHGEWYCADGKREAEEK